LSPRRKKSDTPKTEVMALDLTTAERIAALPRDLQKRMNACVYIIADLVIKSNEDVLRKFDAVSDLVLHDIISPKKGDTLIKAISGAATAREKFLNIDWPEQMTKEINTTIQKFKDSWFAAMKSVLGDSYAAVRKRFDELTGNK
jgi:hypothetical protein